MGLFVRWFFGVEQKLGCFLADLRAEIWLPSGVPIVMCVFSGREAAIKGTWNYKTTSW